MVNDKIPGPRYWGICQPILLGLVLCVSQAVLETQSQALDFPATASVYIGGTEIRFGPATDLEVGVEDGNLILEAADAATWQHPSGASYVAAASALASGGALDVTGQISSPALVSVSAEINLIGNPDDSFLGSLFMSSGASITFGVQVREVFAPPIPVTSVPVIISASGEASIIASGNASGNASFSLATGLNGQNTILGDSVSTAFGSKTTTNFDAELTLDLSIGSPTIFTKRASVHGNAGGFGDGAFSGTSAFDPIFTFDQQAFDLLMGTESFKLADYFVIDVSEGIVNGLPSPDVVPSPSDAPVPEPMTGMLAILSISGLAWSLNRRRG